MDSRDIESFFLGSQKSWQLYQQAILAAEQALADHYIFLSQPFSGISVRELKSLLAKNTICPTEGRALSSVLAEVGEQVLRNSIVVHDPRSSGHLHCAPLIPALAAEMMISATNQSMDSWDQSPAATLLEERVVQWLTQLCYGEGRGDGVFTSGGTQSNLMGLLLARDTFFMQKYNWNVKKRGLPPIATKLRILCSSDAHFSVKQAATLLGLGEDAVVGLPTNDDHQLERDQLERAQADLEAQGLIPFALLATAGTTDFGSIDRLSELGTWASAEELWFHVDASYGGGCLLSDQHREKLAGIEQADSMAIDFHKMFYQPISCGAFLVRDQQSLQIMRRQVDYLNPIEDEAEGIPHLVGKSIQTTRRFDALKLYISLQTVGKNGFAQMIDHTMEIARQTVQLITDDAELECISRQPQLNAVVFRYLPSQTAVTLTEADRINSIIRHQLLYEGQAVLAQTRVAGQLCLKMTILNPLLKMDQIVEILEQLKQIGQREVRNDERKGNR